METSLVFLFVRRFLSHMRTVIVHSRMTRHDLVDRHVHHSRDGVFATPASAATYSQSRRRNSAVVSKVVNHRRHDPRSVSIREV